MVGALAFLETGAFIGLIAPGETALLLGGLVAGQGEVDVLTMIAVVWACAVAGDLTSFFLGRRLGRAFMVKHGAKVQITEARLEQVERFFDRHGGKAILIGRFVGLVRAVAPFMAGSSGMPLRRFVPYDVVGAGLWGSTFVVLGYVFWQSFSQLVDYAKTGALALGAVIVLVVAIVWLVRWVRDPDNRERMREWMERQGRSRCARWSRAPRRCYGPRAGPPASCGTASPPGDLGLELTTLLAVASVGVRLRVGPRAHRAGRRPARRRRGVTAPRRPPSHGRAGQRGQGRDRLGSLPVAIALVSSAAGGSHPGTDPRSGALGIGLALTYAAVHIQGRRGPPPAGARARRRRQRGLPVGSRRVRRDWSPSPLPSPTRCPTWPRASRS
jgi:membrane protein DedA with SNARE-associated domain